VKLLKRFKKKILMQGLNPINFHCGSYLAQLLKNELKLWIINFVLWYGF